MSLQILIAAQSLIRAFIQKLYVAQIVIRTRKQATYMPVNVFWRVYLKLIPKVMVGVIRLLIFLRRISWKVQVLLLLLAPVVHKPLHHAFIEFVKERHRMRIGDRARLVAVADFRPVGLLAAQALRQFALEPEGVLRQVLLLLDYWHSVVRLELLALNRCLLKFQ